MKNFLITILILFLFLQFIVNYNETKNMEIKLINLEKSIIKLETNLSTNQKRHENKILRLDRRFDIVNSSINDLKTSIKSLRKDLISNSMAEKIETIISGISNKQDKCVAIGKWIAGNMRNQFPEDVNYNNDLLKWYATRYGLCNARALLFVEMCKIAGIHARVFNMYAFGRIDGGHSCVQAFYKGKWHFFDPTYGGYFLCEDDILSWDEIKKNPAVAMENMIVFQETKDHHGNYKQPLKLRTVNNNIRMRNIYSEKSISESRSSGFFRYGDKITIYASIDGEKLKRDPLVIGIKDDSWRELRTDGVEKGVCQNLCSLGNIIDFFYHRFEFSKTETDALYSIKIIPVEIKNIEPDELQVTGSGCSILKGKNYYGKGTWEIVFRSGAKDFYLDFKHDYKETGKGMLIDQIIIEKLKIQK